MSASLTQSSDENLFEVRLERALREVAQAAVAEEFDEPALFDLVAEHVVALLGSASAAVARFDAKRLTVLGRAGDTQFPYPDSQPLDASLAPARVASTGSPIRVKYSRTLDSPLARMALAHGITGSLVVPVRIHGQLWGCLGALSADTLPDDAEALLERFATLVSAALAAAQSRRRLVDEARLERALRELSSAIVAGEVDERSLSALVCAPVLRLLDAHRTCALRLEADETLTALGHAGTPPPITGLKLSSPIVALALSGHLFRVEDLALLNDEGHEQILAQGITDVLAAPIRLRGGLWGALSAVTRSPTGFAPGSAQLLGRFASLAATALAHAEALAALRDSAERYRMVVATTSDGVFDSNLSTGELWLSPQLLDLLGYAPENFPGTRNWLYDRIIHPDDAAQLQDAARRALAGERAGQGMYERLVRMRNASGDYQTMMLRSYTLHDDAARPVRSIGSIWDVTESERNEAQRVALARELHDSVVQELAAARTWTATAIRAAAERPELVGEVLAELSSQLQAAEDNMRLIIRALRSDTTLLEGKGSLSALTRALTDELSRRDRALQVNVTDELEQNLEAGPLAAATYGHVLREALLNVLGHSGASTVTVHVCARAGILRLQVSDDGRGFDTDAAPEGHFGVAGMRERALAAGGQLQIQSAPGNGTRITMELPQPFLAPPSDTHLNGTPAARHPSVA